MVETVKDGITGFHCRTFAEFMAALDDVKALDPHAIRRHAIDNYSLPVIAKRYDRHFRRLAQLWGDGWYADR
jgi:glycosyltransferase involved in cell wall biosynthesis